MIIQRDRYRHLQMQSDRYKYTRDRYRNSETYAHRQIQMLKEWEKQIQQQTDARPETRSK